MSSHEVIKSLVSPTRYTIEPGDFLLARGVMPDGRGITVYEVPSLNANTAGRVLIACEDNVLGAQLTFDKFRLHDQYEKRENPRTTGVVVVSLKGVPRILIATEEHLSSIYGTPFDTPGHPPTIYADQVIYKVDPKDEAIWVDSIDLKNPPHLLENDYTTEFGEHRSGLPLYGSVFYLAVIDEHIIIKRLGNKEDFANHRFPKLPEDSKRLEVETAAFSLYIQNLISGALEE